jgi:hypothetical protein
MKFYIECRSEILPKDSKNIGLWVNANGFMDKDNKMGDNLKEAQKLIDVKTSMTSLEFRRTSSTIAHIKEQSMSPQEAKQHEKSHSARQGHSPNMRNIKYVLRHGETRLRKDQDLEHQTFENIIENSDVSENLNVVPKLDVTHLILSTEQIDGLNSMLHPFNLKLVFPTFLINLTE